MHFCKTVIFSLVIPMVNCLINLDLINGYFKEKSIRYGTVFGCFNRLERIELARHLVKSHKIAVKTIRDEWLDLLETQHYHIGIVLDGDCPESLYFLQKCGDRHFFDSKHHWLISALSLFEITEKIDRTALNIDADIKIAVPSGANWTIFDIYNPASRHGGKLNVTKVGFFSKIGGFQVKMAQLQYWSRRNLTGVTFKGMIVLPEHFQGTLAEYLERDDHVEINTFNRFHERIMGFCHDYYNYSVNISMATSWGYIDSSGNFDGLTGALEQKTVDFGYSPLFIREDRARVLDYGRNTWFLTAAFLFRNPKSRTSFDIYIKPLSGPIWACTALLAIFSVILLKFAMNFERKRLSYRDNDNNWSFSVIFTLGAFCQQGSKSTPELLGGRIVTLFIFLLSLVIYQFYAGSIVSHLLMEPTTTIRSIQDILKSPIKAGCQDILYTRDYFARTTDVDALSLYQKKILDKNNKSHFLKPEAGLELVQKGGYAFHVELATAYPIIRKTFKERIICQLKQVKLFPTQPMFANYQKRSPFRDMIDTCLHRMAENGMLYRERHFWHPTRPECIHSVHKSIMKVGLQEFYPALTILIVGAIFSLILLGVERQIHSMEGNAVWPYLE